MIAARSVVGDCSTRGLLLSAMTPTLTFLGTPARKLFAARRAAMSRLGATSVACIEPETSVTSMIEARSMGDGDRRLRACRGDDQDRQRQREGRASARAGASLGDAA